MSIIRLSHISKSFENKKVLDDVSLNIEQGESFLIMGRSGAGKTVLLKHMLGLLLPDKGDVYVDKANLTKLPKERLDKIRLKFGIVFQNSALFDSLTIKENVGFALYHHSNMSEAQILKEVTATLRMVGLSGIEDRYPYELSGGMRKRVAIARAVIYRPKIIIYDEPTTGVDPISVDKIVLLINDLHERFSITTLVVTHDLPVGLKLAQRCAFLLKGKIIFEGKREELERVQDKRVIQFMEGSSEGPINETEV